MADAVYDQRCRVMDGDAAYHRILKLCEARRWQTPHVVFILSLDAFGRYADLAAKDPRACVMMKPFKPETLIDVVRQRLEGL